MVSAQTVVRGSAPGSSCPRPTATQRATTGHPTPPPERGSKRAPVSQVGRAEVPTRGHIRDLSISHYACRQECFVLPPPTGWLPLAPKGRSPPRTTSADIPSETPVTPTDDPGSQHRRRFPSHTQSLRRLPSVRIRTRPITAPTNNPTAMARICSEGRPPTPRESIPQRTPDGRTTRVEGRPGHPPMPPAGLIREVSARVPARRPAGLAPPVGKPPCTPVVRPVGNHPCARAGLAPPVGKPPCTPAVRPVGNHRCARAGRPLPVALLPAPTVRRAAPRRLPPGPLPGDRRRARLRAFPEAPALTPRPVHRPGRRACLPVVRCPPGPLPVHHPDSNTHKAPLLHLRGDSSPGRNRCSPRTPWVPPRT